MDPAQGGRWRERVQRVLDKHAWDTVQARQEFFAAVIEDLQVLAVEAEASDEVVERTVTRHYCAHLWEACASADVQVQQQALLYVWNYLLPRAHYRVHVESTAEEVTQQALVKVWEKRASCLDPGAFLGWADQVLLNVIRDRQRKLYRTRDGVVYERRELGLEALIPDEQAELDKRIQSSGESVPDPVDTAMQFAMRNEVLATLRNCLGNERYVNVIVERFLNDKSFAQVGAALQATALNVQVMTSRAMAKLRDCPEMKQVYAEWLN